MRRRSSNSEIGVKRITLAGLAPARNLLVVAPALLTALLATVSGGCAGGPGALAGSDEIAYKFKRGVGTRMFPYPTRVMAQTIDATFEEAGMKVEMADVGARGGVLKATGAVGEPIEVTFTPTPQGTEVGIKVGKRGNDEATQLIFGGIQKHMINERKAAAAKAKMPSTDAETEVAKPTP
jgi:hypothetical protein